jgi:hypothetical protein
MLETLDHQYEVVEKMRIYVDYLTMRNQGMDCVQNVGNLSKEYLYKDNYIGIFQSFFHNPLTIFYRRQVVNVDLHIPNNFIFGFYRCRHKLI